MSLADVVDLLACPVCSGTFTLDQGRLACDGGHSFDVARQGHVNLLQGPQPANADTPDMVASRLAFLEGGHYDPIADALDAAVGTAATILDAGAGPGWYLARLLGVRPGGRGVAVDVSVAACRRAARAPLPLGAVVADLWQGLPLAPGSIDAVTCVFAPRNAVEFARVLRPGGRLVVVTPGPGHLAEARAALGLLDVDPAKAERLQQALGGAFSLAHEESVRATMHLPQADVAAVVEMGPNAHHRHADATDAMDVTLDVVVSTWLPRAGGPLAG